MHCPELQNSVCESLAEAFILFLSNGFCLIIWVRTKERVDETCCHQESSAEKAVFTALGVSMDTTPLGLQALLTVSAVYFHQLMIHLEGLLLITWQRNKHHLCLPWSQNSVRIDLSLLISTKENWIAQNILNRTIQNAEVKASVQTKEQLKGVSNFN